MLLIKTYIYYSTVAYGGVVLWYATSMQYAAVSPACSYNATRAKSCIASPTPRRLTEFTSALAHHTLCCTLTPALAHHTLCCTLSPALVHTTLCCTLIVRCCNTYFAAPKEEIEWIGHEERTAYSRIHVYLILYF